MLTQGHHVKTHIASQAHLLNGLGKARRYRSRGGMLIRQQQSKAHT
jgi:hypothetical protein